MFKNALVYRIVHWQAPELADFEARLVTTPFVPCGPSQPEAMGWVAPRGEPDSPFVESVGGQLVLRFVVESKAVPGSAVKARLEEELDKVEHETGRRPKGKRSKELKEQIVHELLPRAFPKRSGTTLWIDAQARLVVVDTASQKKADRATTALIAAAGGGMQLALLQTNSAPATAMAHWLRTKEAPYHFTVDRECELKQPDTEKATVRYARHTLELDEIVAHVEQGKVPTHLALTWQGRVSFVLTEALAIKKIKMLDGVLDGKAADDGGFDTDVAIATGELRQLIPDLIEALDGEQQPALAA